MAQGRQAGAPRSRIHICSAASASPSCPAAPDHAPAPAAAAAAPQAAPQAAAASQLSQKVVAAGHEGAAVGSSASSFSVAFSSGISILAPLRCTCFPPTTPPRRQNCHWLTEAQNSRSPIHHVPLKIFTKFFFEKRSP